MKLITLDTAYDKYNFITETVDVEFREIQYYYPEHQQGQTFWQFCEKLKSQGYKII